MRPGGGGVCLLHDRGEDRLHDARGGLVRDRVVHHERAAPLLHSGRVGALAHLAERRLQICRVRDGQHLAQLARCRRLGLIEQADPADLDHGDVRRAGVLVQRAEQQQEQHREQDGEEQRGPVPDETQEHCPRQGPEGGQPHARYSRPVSCRNTSSSVAPCTRSPASAWRSARPASTRGRLAGRDGERYPVVGDAGVCRCARPGTGQRAGVGGRQQAGFDADPDRTVESPHQRGGRAELQHLAVVHDRDAVAQGLGLVHVMGGQHHRPAVGIDLPEQVPQVPPGLRIEGAGRLIQEHQLWSVHQRAGDGQPLRLTARQLLGAHVTLLIEADYAEHLVRAAGGHSVQRGERADLLACGEPLEEGRRLKLDADPGQQRRVAWPRRQAQHAELAAIGLPQALEYFQRRGLARTVRPQDAEELAVLDLETDARYRGNRPVRLPQLADTDDGRHRITITRYSLIRCELPEEGRAAHSTVRLPAASRSSGCAA